MAQKKLSLPAKRITRRTLKKNWPVFVFTSCLAGLEHDAATAQPQSMDASLLTRFDPQTLPEKEYELLKLSVNEIVDEFFHDDSEDTFDLASASQGGGGDGGTGQQPGSQFPGEFPQGPGEYPGGGGYPSPPDSPADTPGDTPPFDSPPDSPPDTPADSSPDGAYPSPSPSPSPSPGGGSYPNPAPSPSPGGAYPAPGGNPAPNPNVAYPNPSPSPAAAYPNPNPNVAYPNPSPSPAVAYPNPSPNVAYPNPSPSPSPNVAYPNPSPSPSAVYYPAPAPSPGYYPAPSPSVIYYDACYDPPPYGAGMPDSFYDRAPTLPLEDAEPEDVRYRDLCVSGADLTQTDFDPMTGNVNAPDIPLYGFGVDYDYGYQPDSLSVFEQQFVGTVSGAKPLRAECMPMKDTPKIDLTVNSANANLAFHYFMNLQDNPFYSDPTFGFDVHGASNYYRDKTFFIGGTLGCPDLLQYITPPDPTDRTTIPLRVDYHRIRAENCYNYYVLNRAMEPWFALERPDEGTDDPYTMVDPDRAFHNTCQPLAAGNHVRDLQLLAWADDPMAVQQEKAGAYDKNSTGGFSKVLQFNGRPDLDEAEYMLSTYLQSSWDKNFVNFSHPDFMLVAPQNKTIPDIGLPCVVGDAADSLGDSPPIGPGDGLPLCDTSADTPPPDSYYDCTPPYFPLPADKPYISKNQGMYYCPNVEKITEPEHPFTPRQDITTTGHTTDREYSIETSQVVQTCPAGSELGYTNFAALNPRQQFAFPTVQCAIVPVDILSFRREQFDICIMQRINYNFNDWIANDYPDQLSNLPGAETWEPGLDGVTPWEPPCKTRYYETDSFAECPVKFSIQQCCRILVKDVVPANFLKMRTCEGLLQKRRDDPLIQNYFGNPDPPITHITNDSFGGFIGRANYINAKLATYYLNTQLCDDTEPDEYRFDHWFSNQKFYEDYTLSDPPIPTVSVPGYGYGGGGTMQLANYLGVHMPYMRWWDTGVSAGNPRHGGSYVNTRGSFDTIVGIGREERDDFAAEEQGQFAEDNNAPQPIIDYIREPKEAQIGRIGGWAELKAHQMQSVRRNNLYCLGRYERLFKPGSGENFVLAKAGAGYTSQEGIQWPWSLGWRGYVTDTHDEEFPNVFGSAPGAAMVSGGLDNALPGDIIIYEVNGLRQIAYVTDIGGYAEEGGDIPLPNDTIGVFDFSISRYRKGDDTGVILHPTRIFVVTWDQGKFPSSTGITINWGLGPERTIYKEEVPDTYREDICNMDLRALTDKDPLLTFCKDNIADDPYNGITLDAGECMTNDCQPSCVDIDYSACVLPNSKDDWNTAIIYRPYHDIQRCPGTPSDPTFSMTSTYDWVGNVVLSLAPPDPAVIYQGMTQRVGTDLWAFCVNGGYDPPAHYTKDYKGPQTGALTDTTLCEAPWRDDASPYPDTGCSSTAPQNRFFPEK